MTKDAAYIYNGILAIKNEILPFGTSLYLYSIFLSEKNSEMERQRNTTWSHLFVEFEKLRQMQRTNE